jgi:hypothetical protein
VSFSAKPSNAAHSMFAVIPVRVVVASARGALPTFCNALICLRVRRRRRVGTGPLMRLTRAADRFV